MSGFTDNCFKLFNLNNKASQKELEIAYDVLTKNISDDELMKEYRFAFEYLMTNFYGAVSSGTDEEDISGVSKEEQKKQEAYETIVNSSPIQVKNSIEELSSLLGDELLDRVKALFAIQQVNLSMFITNIYKRKRKLFGLSFWLKQDMVKIFEECCLNELQYATATFDIELPDIIFDSKISAIQESIKGIAESYIKEPLICPRFDVKNTKFGVSCYITLEINHMTMLEDYLQNKAKLLECNLNMVRI